MFDVIQIFYWLALSTWFGGVLFVAIVAPVIFRTIREADPTLPRVLSVNLERKHSVLLASLVVGNLWERIVWIALGCAGVLVLTSIAQWFFLDTAGAKIIPPLVRATLLVVGGILLIYDWRFVWPKVQMFRQEYLDHADEPEIANPAMEQFERHGAESFMILQIISCVLLGIILFSGDIRPMRSLTSAPTNASQSK